MSGTSVDARRRSAQARRGMAVGLASAAVVVMGAPSALAVPAAGAPTPLTAAAAKAIVRRYDAANARNNATLDLAGQDAVETGPLGQIDDTSYAEARGRAQTRLGGRFDIDQVAVFVPRQEGSPRQFLATERVSTGNGSFRQLLVFRQPSASEPWRAFVAAQPVGAGFPRLLRGHDGAASLVDADHAAALRVAPDAVPKLLADLWARQAGTERAPSKAFASGPVTTGAVQTFVSELAQLGIEADVDFGFEPNEAGVVAYRSADGGALAIVPITIHETVRPSAGADRLSQPASRTTFTGLVAPGDYAEVRFDRVALVAVAIPVTSAKRSARVRGVGLYDGFVAATGDPLGTPPTPPSSPSIPTPTTPITQAPSIPE